MYVRVLIAPSRLSHFVTFIVNEAFLYNVDLFN